MGCCGKVRQSIGSALRRPDAGNASPPRRLNPVFAYTGATALTVRGPVSGRLYRFDRTGARLAVDPRDRPALARVPHLREVG
ncbi:MAG: hypothetical protein MUC56_08785 [Thermoanaerobaculales bacterium]|jgi:hypothetical protein|nr:hypothetical protein [Thermoanaerobaculales bacterium]